MFPEWTTNTLTLPPSGPAPSRCLPLGLFPWLSLCPHLLLVLFLPLAVLRHIPQLHPHSGLHQQGRRGHDLLRQVAGVVRAGFGQCESLGLGQLVNVTYWHGQFDLVTRPAVHLWEGRVKWSVWFSTVFVLQVCLIKHYLNFSGKH